MRVRITLETIGTEPSRTLVAATVVSEEQLAHAGAADLARIAAGAASNFYHDVLDHLATAHSAPAGPATSQDQP